MDKKNKDLNHNISSDTASRPKLKPSEERRIKAAIKRGKLSAKDLVLTPHSAIKLHESSPLHDMVKRCPDLKNVIAQTLSQKVNQIPNKRSDRKIITTANIKPNINKQKITKKRITKPRSDDSESLGSSDTDEELRDSDDSIPNINEYEKDGFVVSSDNDSDNDSENVIDSIPKSRKRLRESDDLIRETNDLYDDYYDSKESDPIVDKKIHDIRNQYHDSQVNLKKVMEAGFNTEDSLWFYKQFKRLQILESNDRFALEDKIENKFNFLINLKNKNMYHMINSNNGIDIISKRIFDSMHPEHVKHILLNRLLSHNTDSTEEYQKIISWINTVLSIPTEIKIKNKNINLILKKLYDSLSQNMYGMENTIKQILQAVCMILSDPLSQGSVLTLVGPPGVGKTTISTLIADAIGMGFSQISCGSIADQATVIGHSSTYIGSTPGIMTQCMINNKQLDNVILFDEMDKMYDSKILPILLHVLDKSQNSRYKDAYCPEIDIDMSKNLFIIAVNSLDNFDSALIDRMKIIYLPGYNVDQKTQICIKHVIPKLIKKTNINIQTDLNVIKQCIEKVSPEISGVRVIERYFSDIYEKLLLIKNMDPQIYQILYNIPKLSNINKLDLKLIKQLSD
jgi:ATP-dependent Lon protease